MDNAQGRGPSGWLRTSPIWRFRFSAINIIWANRFLSAFYHLFGRFALDLHLSVQVGKCSMTQSGIFMELGLRWLWLQSLYTKARFICLLPNSFSSKQILLYIWWGHFSSRKTYRIFLNATEWIKPMTFISTRDLTSVSSLTILVLWRSVWWKFDLFKSRMSLISLKKILRYSATKKYLLTAPALRLNPLASPAVCVSLFIVSLQA